MTSQMSHSTVSEPINAHDAMTYTELRKKLAEQNISMGIGRITGGVVTQPLQDLIRGCVHQGIGGSTVEAVNDALGKLYEARRIGMN